jgi:CheY-like chemotaxis protein
MRGHRHLVVLVDDDGPARDRVRDLLLARGIDALGARHGRAALQLLALGIRPCALFVDLDKPAVAGAELRRALQYDPRYRAIPVGVLPPPSQRDGDGPDALPAVLGAVLRACPELQAFRRPPTHGGPCVAAVRPPRRRDGQLTSK